MATNYGFFNSINHDRTYNADDMSEYFKGLVSNGVYESVGNALQVLAGSGLSVQVQTGRALIDCKWFENDAVFSVTLNTAHVTLNRITAIVLRLDRANRLLMLTAKDGANATNPVAPAMTNNGIITEICLATVYVAAGATNISQANITDTRANTNVCGWVTGLIQQVDTSTLFLQWQTAYENYYNDMTNQFNAWFESLTKQLNVNTYIEQYNKRVELDGSTYVIELDMDGYDYEESDIINVYINGLLASNSYDYYLDTTASPVELHPSTSAAGNVIEIQVLKSKIGFPSSGTVSAVTLEKATQFDNAVNADTTLWYVKNNNDSPILNG